LPIFGNFGILEDFVEAIELIDPIAIEFLLGNSVLKEWLDDLLSY
jgi:hypothetical protein